MNDLEEESLGDVDVETLKRLAARAMVPESCQDPQTDNALLL